MGGGHLARSVERSGDVVCCRDHVNIGCVGGGRTHCGSLVVFFDCERARNAFGNAFFALYLYCGSCMHACVYVCMRLFVLLSGDAFAL